MAQFLPECLASVSGQGLSAWEHLVLDGGSTDGTRAILEAYAARFPGHVRLFWGPDGGAAAALEKGLQAARGEFFGWVNADDRLLPGALPAAVRALQQHPQAAAVYAAAEWVDEAGRPLGDYPVEPFRLERLAESCFICQPACWMRTDLVRRAGGIGSQWQTAFDFDLWWRLAKQGSLVQVEGRWAQSRMHTDNKTLGQRERVLEESMEVVRRHFGYVPFCRVHSLEAWKLDGRDQYFAPLRPTLGAYLRALPAGLRQNAGQRWRYLKEWAAVASPAGLGRHLRRQLGPQQAA